MQEDQQVNLRFTNKDPDTYDGLSSDDGSAVTNSADERNMENLAWILNDGLPFLQHFNEFISDWKNSKKLFRALVGIQGTIRKVSRVLDLHEGFLEDETIEIMEN